MTLLRVCHRILNLDTVTTVNLAYPAGPTETCVRVFFVGGTNAELSWTDFKGEDGEFVRGYFLAKVPVASYTKVGRHD